MSSAERVGNEIAKSLAYSKKVKAIPDEKLMQLRDSYKNSRFRNLCKRLYFPILENHYNSQEELLNSELLARDAVRRYQRGEAVCGITGF